VPGIVIEPRFADTPRDVAPEGSAVLAKLEQATPGEHDQALSELAAWWFAHEGDREQATVALVARQLETERARARAAEIATAESRLACARHVLEAEHANQGLAPPTSETWTARFERARIATRANPLAHHVLEDGKKVTWHGMVVRRLDERGFALASTKHTLEATWTQEPTLGLEVLAHARRTPRDERARDLLDDARLAISLERWKEADLLLAERTRLVPGSVRPDVSRIRATRPFPGTETRTREADGVTRLSVSWPLASPEDAESFSTTVLRWHALSTKVHVEKGILSVIEPGETSWIQTARGFDTARGEIALEAEIETKDEGSPYAGLLLELPGNQWRVLTAAVRDGRRLVVTLDTQPECPQASRRRGRLLETALDARGSVAIRVGLSAAGVPSVSVNGETLEISAPPLATPVQAIPIVGNAGGFRASFSRLALSVPVRDAWLRKLDEEHAHVLASELAKTLGAPPPRPVLAAAPATLDAALARSGLTPAHLAALDEARSALERDDETEAANLAQGVLERSPWSPAAHLVLAATYLDDAPEESLRSIDRVLQALPGHAEALALRALARLRLGQLDLARRDVELALSARPDSAPAIHARACLAILEGGSAPQDLDLASLLAPGDRTLKQRIQRARKAAGGPWSLERTRRRVTPHYVVLTDTDDATADTVAQVVEDARVLFEKTFGARDRKPGSVLVFDTQAAFKEWADNVMPGSGDHTSGFYDPFHDQLCLFQPAHDPDSSWTRCVTVHEAFHQYAFHALGNVPVWLNEGLAESFGLEVAYGGNATVRTWGIDECLKKARTRADWRHFFRISYGEFHATGVRGGQKDEHASYARALIAARLLREGKGPLEGVLARLVAAIEKDEPLEPLLGNEVIDALERGFAPCARRSLGR
jgi:tetratricopeptide (TPR) repeat protein